MTRNQLQYHANQEIARSNRAKEAETNRSNLRSEQISYDKMKLDKQIADQKNATQLASTIMGTAGKVFSSLI